jgi:D-lyxose ketol-isomerase
MRRVYLYNAQHYSYNKKILELKHDLEQLKAELPDEYHNKIKIDIIMRESEYFDIEIYFDRPMTDTEKEMNVKCYTDYDVMEYTKLKNYMKENANEKD